MDVEKQRTVARELTLDGIGVHSGESASLTIGPGEANSGIVFVRADIDDAPDIPADFEHVVDTDLGTSLGCADVRVLTVEHVMAALSAAGVDNARLELTGPELPIRDGSFTDYFSALMDAGFIEQDEPARRITITDPIAISGSEGRRYGAVPSDELRITATIDFEHPSIGRQSGSFGIDCESFRGELAPARTFGFKEDADALRERGLALGASMENTVVLDARGVMNDGLRFPDEFLRHKVGDILGDLALLGARVTGHIIADRPSHAGNIAMAKAIRAQALKNGGEPIVDVRKILEYLPHRYPMLLVDRVIEFESGKRIVGIKNVTINEPFFQGHYPGHPIMPGVLIIEAMAQVGGLLLMEDLGDPEGRVVYFMSLDKVKWRRPVTPGDQLVFEVVIVKMRRGVCKMRGVGRVDGHVVAEGDFMARIMDR